MKRKNKIILIDSILGFLIGIIIFGFGTLLLTPFFNSIEDKRSLFFFISAIVVNIIEEIFKFIPLRFYFKSRFVLNGFMVGLGFGLFEYCLAVVTYLGTVGSKIYTARITPLILHITTGAVLGYFISKKKSMLGLIIAILLHLLYNFVLAKIIN